MNPLDRMLGPIPTGVLAIGLVGLVAVCFTVGILLGLCAVGASGYLLYRKVDADQL